MSTITATRVRRMFNLVLPGLVFTEMLAAVLGMFGFMYLASHGLWYFAIGLLLVWLTSLGLLVFTLFLANQEDW